MSDRTPLGGAQQENSPDDRAGRHALAAKAGLLWLFEDLLAPDARASLPGLVEDAGLKLALSGFGMADDVLPLPEPAGAGLTFRRVRSEDDLLAYADVNARAYGVPVEVVCQGSSGSALWTRGMHAFLGLVDGRPVTTAAAVEADGCLFVALVATLPEHQRRGYAEAVMRKARTAPASGARRCTRRPRAAPSTSASACARWPPWGSMACMGDGTPRDHLTSRHGRASRSTILSR